jgi:hypothetical protein
MDNNMSISTNTPPKNVWGGSFWAENQGNHQNFDPTLISKKLSPIFVGMKQKKKKIEKNTKMTDSKKLSFSKSPILKIFLPKIYWIGP